MQSHHENLTTLENSIRQSKVSRLRLEAETGGGLLLDNTWSQQFQIQILTRGQGK